MPLIKSKSKGAFKSNLEAEVDDGKPLKQALAISFGIKRKAGGAVRVKTLKNSLGRNY